MLAAIHHAPVAAADIEELRARMPTIPTRPDVPSGLKQLKEAGFGLVACANSPPDPEASRSISRFPHHAAAIGHSSADWR
jgi:2-haloacid dehalogenase